MVLNLTYLYSTTKQNIQSDSTDTSYSSLIEALVIDVSAFRVHQPICVAVC